MFNIYTLFEDHIPRMTKVTQKIVSGQSTWGWVQQAIPPILVLHQQILTCPVRAPPLRRKSKWSLFGRAPETKDHTRTVICVIQKLWGWQECRRHDGQELESNNKNNDDLPYCHHKRACLSLVCGVLMQGENKYMLEWQYLCILTTCDQLAWQTIKEGHGQRWKKTLCARGIEYYWRQCHQWIIWKTIGYGVAQRRVQLVTEFQSWITYLSLWCCSVGFWFFSLHSSTSWHAIKINQSYLTWSH